MDSTEALIVGIGIGAIVTAFCFLVRRETSTSSLPSDGIEGILIERNPTGDLEAILKLRPNTFIDRDVEGRVKGVLPLVM